MNYSRRKKKRINYGVRAVELTRGIKGFGFTISGQQPCILSCIVPGSPADIAGLRAGDYLIAVNSFNVGKTPHDDVVKLIGHSSGILRLQIAENYYSDSSDDEGLTTARIKPKYSHKQKSVCGNTSTTTSTTTNTTTATTSSSSLTTTKTTTTTAQVQCRVAKVVRDLQTGAMFDDNNELIDRLPIGKLQCNQNGIYHRWNLSNSVPLPPPPPPPPPHLHKRDTEKIVHRTVVGYLGTIDIPNIHPSTMMQVLKKCIKRLKAEKRNPTTVLLTIHVTNIKLTNSDNKIIAEYPSYRIVFCNSFSEHDKQYFGILTKTAKDNDDIVSNSCHVFKIYDKLIDHSVHLNTCCKFNFTCTKTCELNVCQEFPDSCNGLIGAIKTLYITDTNNNNNTDTNNYTIGDNRRRDTVSPQPSNISTSTAHSSNSDSGIGFKDDYGSQSDFLQQRNKCQQSINPRSSSVPCTFNIVNNNKNISLTNLSLISHELYSLGNRETIRASCSNIRKTLSIVTAMDKVVNGDDVGNNNNIKRDDCSGDVDGDVDTNGGDKSITCSQTSAQNFVNTSSHDISSVGSSTFSRTIAGMLRPNDIDDYCDFNHLNMCNKLSPKVFNTSSKSFIHSMEDLKQEKNISTMDLSFLNKSDVRPWGSLQEIRNVGGFESDCMFYSSTESCDKTDVDVHTWATGFEKLLQDPKGLQTFAEFLKKEFSHENIYFWAASERYNDTEDVSARRTLAWQIYQRHLSTTAVEPVNVDSHAAGQITQELINLAPEGLFLHAQKQVFNLMKFDSYPRFLRSDLYRKCLETGRSVVSNDDQDLTLTNSPSVKLKKSHSDAEDRCRKSILPWHRKNRSKSKDRGESEYKNTPTRGETIYKSFTKIKRETEGNNNDDNVSISSSRSSLASWDLALRQSFSKHMANLKYPSSVLSGQEVEVVPTKVLKVDLPSRRNIITVVAHKGRSLKEVLRPLLNKYGFKMEMITIWGDGQQVSLDIPAINAPVRLILTSNNDDYQRDNNQCQEDIPQGQSTLDEITNKVFEELLVGKSSNKNSYHEGSYKSDDQRSESSSILSSKLFSRDTFGKKKSKSKSSNISVKSNSTDIDTGEESSHSNKTSAPLIAKLRNGVKLQLPGKFDGDELYEGLKRAQRSRLEDQRGTEINFELPDFLKQNKENGKRNDDKKNRKCSSISSGNRESTSKFYDSSDDNNKQQHQQNSLCREAKKPRPFSGESHSMNFKGFDPRKRLDSTNSLDGTLEDTDKTIIGIEFQSSHDSLIDNQFLSSPMLMKPPPLPPKPKGLQRTNIMKNKISPTKLLPMTATINNISSQELRNNNNSNNIF
ncbi:hypothetical protein HCN44_004529 [Aphidius gifuensis]|uniref:Regulator of G-protein signaling loco n=1 Tax=Aphidius gifuensis TaxID=684658 RepID=A0A835CT61_APHGI|nr:regulator of G-protein signaling loco isoform X2 [Aphidius gifuensis]KAF7995057.1 hypothetical protein HCN44_004529 [Aphidius gifuensis]